MSRRPHVAPALAFTLALACGQSKAPPPAGSPDAGTACVADPTPLAAAVPAVGRACASDAGAPAFSASRPFGLGYPDGAPDQLPARVAYLTFDDGPSEWTGEILDTLAAKGVRATFFVNARNLKGPAGLDGTYKDAAGHDDVFRNLIAREVDGGHALGNHTVDHKDLASLSLTDAAAALDDNERLVSEALVETGRAARLLTLVRPPFGSPWFPRAPPPADPAAAVDGVGRLVANRGIDVLWTIDSSDSREWAQGESYTRVAGKVTIPDGAPTFDDKVARIAATVLTDPSIAAGAGAIILLHDSHNATRDALAAIIDGLRAAGYTFGTVEELVVQRWGRPSAAVTPGPALFSACVAESDQGCEVAAGTAVCGRVWRAYARAGGAAALGAPAAAATTDAATGVTSQTFERGRLELNPGRAAPCDATLTPAN